MNRSGIWILLLLSVGSVEAADANICYVLDGILVLYGIVLTVLYCRLRMKIGEFENKMPSKGKEESLYQDLRVPTQDTYEKLPMKK
ncbi:Fc receptor, IgE, high affinity I, gamma polypeptide like isoform X1 [Trichomycterus rosablanca]|uniref:Fc receptor, IgE, high affinity I, gamma polypeptide like isoform X1 n=1 Tax=Trichomycterus rosablanca TaxID=2290929 RepID=UPI002F3511A4